MTRKKLWIIFILLTQGVYGQSTSSDSAGTVKLHYRPKRVECLVSTSVISLDCDIEPSSGELYFESTHVNALNAQVRGRYGKIAHGSKFLLFTGLNFQYSSFGFTAGQAPSFRATGSPVQSHTVYHLKTSQSRFDMLQGFELSIPKEQIYFQGGFQIESYYNAPVSGDWQTTVTYMPSDSVVTTSGTDVNRIGNFSGIFVRPFIQVGFRVPFKKVLLGGFFKSTIGRYDFKAFRHGEYFQFGISCAMFSD